MASDWEWRPSGLYDGSVPIVWAAQAIQGELFVGVMEDWAEWMRNLPDLVAACGSAHWVLENRHNQDTAQWEEYAKAALDDLDRVLKGAGDGH